MTRLYERISFPPAPPERPYIFCNMVATIDGKTVSGERNEPVQELGSAVDHAALRDLEAAADAVLIGAGTLRATPKLWFPNHLLKIVATQSGQLPWESRFFTDAPERTLVFGPSSLAPSLPAGANFLNQTEGLGGLLQRLRAEFQIQKLLCEGGSELNAQLLSADVVDEVFLTIAPKMKLGAETPTYAGGSPLPSDRLLKFALLDCKTIDDEVFLRYRRAVG